VFTETEIRRTVAQVLAVTFFDPAVWEARVERAGHFRDTAAVVARQSIPLLLER
jgi:hypothetical protein